jgi:hypothetical protein
MEVETGIASPAPFHHLQQLFFFGLCWQFSGGTMALIVFFVCLIL